MRETLYAIYVLQLATAAGTYEASAGAPVRAVLVAVVGLIVVAGLPDLLVRPRLARSTAGISGSLYFVGFVGGLLTLGPVGIVAGPLVVALVVEATAQLTADTNGRDGMHGDAAVDSPGDEPRPPPPTPSSDTSSQTPSDPPRRPTSDSPAAPPGG